MAEFRQSKPMTAFLAGRQRLADRQRRNKLDDANLTSNTLNDTLRRFQIGEIAGEPARRREEEARNMEVAEQQRRALMAAVGTSDLPASKKRQFALAINAGQGDKVAAALVGRSSGKEGASGFTLAQGARRFGPDGKLIAENPKSATDDLSAAEEEIARLESIGLTTDQAIKVNSGLAKLETDPAGGVVRFIDLAAQLQGDPNAVTEVAIQPSGGRQDAPEIQQSDTLWELSKDATGPANTVSAGLSVVLGAAGIDSAVDEKTIEARKTFNTSQQSVIRAFSLNPRYPVAEQDRIRETITVLPKFLDSPKLMQTEMRSLDRFLKQELESAKFVASQPGVGRKQRNKEEALIASISNFRRLLGVPDEGRQSQIKILSRRPVDAQ